MGACCIDYEQPTLFREEWVNARKQHKCCECYAHIQRGGTYQKTTMLYEGIWEEYKTCELCADLRASLSDVTCPFYEGLSECFTDWLCEGKHTVMAVKPGTHAAKLVPDYYLDKGE